MKISVYSKAAIERIIAEEKFPKDTKDGISVFADYNYYPNQVVFHKVYDALVKMNSAYCNTYHSSEATDVETLLLKQSFEKDDCYHSLEEAYFRLRHDIAKVNISLHIDDARNENFKTS